MKKKGLGEWVCFISEADLYLGYILDSTSRSAYVKVRSVLDRKSKQFVPTDRFCHTVRIDWERAIELDPMLSESDFDELIDLALGLKDFAWVAELTKQKAAKASKPFLTVKEE